jgi:hypothetical protein
MRSRLVTFGIVLAMIIAFAGTMTYARLASPSSQNYVSAASVGEKDGSDLRALISSGGDDRVRRVIYFKMDNHTTGGANTPVPSAKVCGLAGLYHYAEVQLSGTMDGTAPTLAIKWQNSKDNGSTWSDVGTWTTINATVTPATQSNTVADHGNQSYTNAQGTVTTELATMYGDCWRALYTMTGTGAAANFAVIGAEK